MANWPGVGYIWFVLLMGRVPEMRQLTIALFVVVLCVGMFAQCKQKKAGEGSSKGSDMAPAMGMDAMDDSMTSDMRAGPGMTVAPPVTSGPTGIKECDALLDMLSKCKKKHPSLEIAYSAVKKDAPGWKAKAQKRDPKQIGELAKACDRTAKEVGESFGCKGPK